MEYMTQVGRFSSAPGRSDSVANAAAKQVADCDGMPSQECGSIHDTLAGRLNCLNQQDSLACRHMQPRIVDLDDRSGRRIGGWICGERYLVDNQSYRLALGSLPLRERSRPWFERANLISNLWCCLFPVDIAIGLL